MQPKTNLQYTQHAVKKIKQKIHNTKLCAKEREKDPKFALDVPIEIGLKLTNRCNLRCTHCFQWDIGGYHHSLDKSELKKDGDLSFEIVTELFNKTKEANSSLYLWGGEPTLYAHWDKLMDLLVVDPRETVLCTNGVTLHTKIDSILKVSEYLTVLVSIEGPEDIHNAIRGKDTYAKIVKNLDQLIQLREEGLFKGTLSVEAVISDGLIPQMYEFCEYWESRGIDSLYLNFPWFIPHAVADHMDEYFENKFSWMGPGLGKGNSWHSFDFKISSELIDELKRQMKKIIDRKWNIRIRFHPDLTTKDLIEYIEGSVKPAQDRTRCLGMSNRIDLLPSGQVTPCKKFPEFNVGNLNNKSLEEIWKGDKFDEFRNIQNNGLMDICSKCEILYANGI
ncbi:radical SAM protein [Sphingobacterium faecium NBRC 15299]|uniref:radical SAM/SPASM domain-containing protein n=1 Tax=Sphingobacterium faecium TaxID=34087 RepID=UPI000D384DEB|nr:radical SAM protein [Sphingobacterium faecium]PTX12514.1 radical SAM protein with 4Fe4S-binding SPASM domain [Sphingobacterium faecium]GEM62223.1 radical SAM protein [Sphingobacterium faecium NBRC 15299]